MILDSMIQTWESFAVMLFLASLAGAAVVAAMDGSRFAHDRLAPQH